jgi:membrane fusion protein (multidrug efflux system)
MIGAVVAGAMTGSALSAQNDIGPPQPLTCLLAPMRSSEIGSDLRGIVRDVTVERADGVAEGDPLIQLDTAMAEADLEVALINIAALEERLARNERLVSRNLVSRDEIEAIRTELALARAEEKRARLTLERATIRAPFEGFIADVNVSKGELIGADPLLELIAVNRLKVELVYLAGSYKELEVGDTLRISVDATGATGDAVITSVDPFIDPSSNTFTVIAEADNADRTIPAGSACAVIR